MAIQHDTWLTAVTITGISFIAVFAIIIPTIAAVLTARSKKNTAKQNPDYYWDAAVNVILGFFILCSVAFFVLAFVFQDIRLTVLSGFTFLGTIIIGNFLNCDGEYNYIVTVVGGFALFAVLSGLSYLPVADAQLQAKVAAEMAAYNQTETAYLNADNRKLDSENHTYPISNLHINNTGDTYTWLERREDGTLTTRSVKTTSDGRYEVALKDDLPATDTESRVERTVEYYVKGEDMNAGKEPCAETRKADNFLGFLPACDDGKTPALFSKTRTIVHIPAGSASKMVPVTGE